MRSSREAFADGKRKQWRLNHAPLYLDFLEGKVDFECTPWGIPCYSVFGWQRPCYLMADGYARTYRELLEATDWDKYGRGKRPIGVTTAWPTAATSRPRWRRRRRRSGEGLRAAGDTLRGQVANIELAGSRSAPGPTTLRGRARRARSEIGWPPSSETAHGLDRGIAPPGGVFIGE